MAIIIYNYNSGLFPCVIVCPHASPFVLACSSPCTLGDVASSSVSWQMHVNALAGVLRVVHWSGASAVMSLTYPPCTLCTYMYALCTFAETTDGSVNPPAVRQSHGETTKTA